MLDSLEEGSPFSVEGDYFLPFYISKAFRGSMPPGFTAGRVDGVRKAVSSAWREWSAAGGGSDGLPRAFHRLYMPVLKALGYALRRRSAPAKTDDLGEIPVGYEEPSPRGGCLALAAFMNPEEDADTDVLPGSSCRLPASASLRCAAETEGARWAIIFAGERLRLLDSQSLGFRTVEADIGALVDRDSRGDWLSFAAIFSRLSLAGDFLDGLGEEGLKVAADVSDDLRKSAGEALAELMNGCLAAAGTGKGRWRTEEELADLFMQCTFILYRMLFVLFAESRGLLPMENPTYREGYSIQHLRDAAERGETAGGPYFCRSLEVLFRLVAEGSRSSALRVPAYNGRLFSEKETPVLLDPGIGEEHLRNAILALSLSKSAMEDGRPCRHSYSNFGVAQLGSIFEGLLTLEPRRVSGAAGRRIALKARPGARKEAGAFYTPDWLTSFVVKQALGPLVRGRSAAGILEMKVLDPAMGSGAFLIQALRFLSEAYGRRLAAESAGAPGGAEYRSECKRRVAESCLYGVDRMPLAVELAKVSIWLETAEAGKPLNFLDHRLRPGDSLTGASLGADSCGLSDPDLVPDEALLGWPGLPGGRRSALARINRKETEDVKSGQGLLFSAAGTGRILEGISKARTRLSVPDDTTRTVRGKQKAFSALRSAGSGFDRLKNVLDAWCGLWFPPPGKAPADPPTTQEFREIAAAERDGLEIGVPRLAETARALLSSGLKSRFFHWEIEFPEVFEGRNPGFDAVICNPPWEVLKSNRREFMKTEGEDAESPGERAILARRCEEHARLQRDSARWFRFCGKYEHSASGDLNTYKLFLERGFGLLRDGGRLGAIVPQSFMADEGAAPLRRMLFESSQVNHVYVVDNARGVFPIHRSFKFVLLGLRKGGGTKSFRTIAGIGGPGDLAAARPVRVETGTVEVQSPESFSLSGFESQDAADTVAAISQAGLPACADGRPWGLSFRTEVHVTNDAALLGPWGGAGDWGGGGRLTLCEGKTIWQFRPWSVRPSLCMAEADAAGRTGGESGYKIALRRVARGTDERMLVACVLPSRIPCELNATVARVEGDAVPAGALLYCLAFLNSFALEYVMKRRASATLNIFHLRQAPLPRLGGGRPLYLAICALSARLSCTGERYAALWRSSYSDAWRGFGEESGGWSRTPGWSRLGMEWKPCFPLDGSDGYGRDGGERFEARCELDALAAAAYGLDEGKFRRVVEDSATLGRMEQRRHGRPVSVEGCISAYRRIASVPGLGPVSG